MAFTLEDPNEPAIDTTRGIPEEKAASSWDEQEDYIHKSDDETKSDFEKADKDGDGKIDEKEKAPVKNPRKKLFFLKSTPHQRG